MTTETLFFAFISVILAAIAFVVVAVSIAAVYFAISKLRSFLPKAEKPVSEDA